MISSTFEGYEFRIEQEASPKLVYPDNVIEISELEIDEQLRLETERQIRAVGLMAISSELETTPESNDSLLSAIKRAKTGDPEAKAMVATNVGSDFSERVLKAGEVTKFHLQKNDNGELIQFGQQFSDIYTNTLRLINVNSKMRLRAEAEARNARRLKYLESTGLLTDNYMVVFSLAPDNMTDEELKQSGFFVDTKTMAIQVTTAENSGVSIESAFVAGVPEPSAARLDLQTIVKLAKILGVDYQNLSTAEILDKPLLVPKSLMTNGVIDLVKIFDDINGETFFGETKQRQDYRVFRQFCDERRKSFANDINIVTEQLIDGSDILFSQVQATEKLAELSEAQMVKRAIKDTTINSNVFGKVSASFIEQARIYHNQGNADLALRAENNAIKTADSSSCPSGISRQSDLDLNGDIPNKNKEEQKDCDFVSKKCPICKEKNAKTKVKKGVYYHIGKSCKA